MTPERVRGEKPKSLEALKSMLTLPDDGLIPIGSLPVAIKDSLLESLRDTAGFAEFRQEIAPPCHHKATRGSATNSALRPIDCPIHLGGGFQLRVHI